MSQGGFLPPEAAGREPELERRDQPPPAPALTGGFAPPAGAAAPPGQTGYQPPPAWQHPAPPTPWGPAQMQPDNGPAVLGFSLALASLGLLVVSGGLSSIVSIVLGAVGINQGSKGRQKVRNGETAKHKDLAQAGFVIGIVATVLAVLATLFWIGIGIAIAVDESTRHDFNRELDDSRGEPAVVPTAVLATVRAIGLLLS